MAQWTRDFVQISEVAVANREHFLKSVDSSSSDPCAEEPPLPQESVKVLVPRKKQKVESFFNLTRKHKVDSRWLVQVDLYRHLTS